MLIDEIQPPRAFEIGAKRVVTINHTANIELDSNEQVTFVGSQGSEVDVVKKEWGYYLTPSINKRLKKFEIATYLVQNRKGNIFIMSVENGKDDEFQEYIKYTNQKIIINLSDIYCAT